MPDISLCLNRFCPSRELCYRYTAKPDEHWQAYTPFVLQLNEIRCEYFIANAAWGNLGKDEYD